MTEDLKEISPGIYGLSDTVFMVEGGFHGGAVVEYVPNATAEYSPLRTIKIKNTTYNYASWGTDNNLPAAREQLVMDNNIVPELIQAKLDILLGGGAMLYKEIWEDGKRIIEECEMTNEMKDFFALNEMDELDEMATKDLLFNAQYFPEFIRSRDNKKIAAVNLIEAKYVRAERFSKTSDAARSQIQNWLVSGEWTSSGAKDVEKVAAFNRTQSQKKYIKRFANKFLGGPYYYSPSWWGSRTWIHLANRIPIFHISNLNNGYTIRFHVRIPEDFFWRMVATKPVAAMVEKEVVATQVFAKQKELEFKKKLNELLRGAENAGRAIFTTFDVNKALGKEYAGVEILPINFDMKDDKLLKLFDKSNDATNSSQGILPSLSGIATSGKLSSGSDIRNSFAYWLAARARRPRRQIFSMRNHIGMVNGWFTGDYSNCLFGARDVIITTTDKNKEGIEESPVTT